MISEIGVAAEVHLQVEVVDDRTSGSGTWRICPSQGYAEGFRRIGNFPLHGNDLSGVGNHLVLIDQESGDAVQGAAQTHESPALIGAGQSVSGHHSVHVGR